jgi:hypothetical protein
MWDMARSSIGLFFQGKLFAEPSRAYRQIALGAAITAILVVGLAAAGLPLAASTGVAGLIGGALQPYLFKDLRYR